MQEFVRCPFRIIALETIISAGVQAQSAKQFRTPWGEPDLQGIWNGETLTPLQRPARFANKPVLTPEEAAKEEAEVDSRLGRDKRAKEGTEKDVAVSGRARGQEERRTAIPRCPQHPRIPRRSQSRFHARRPPNDLYRLRLAMLDPAVHSRITA